MIGLMRSWFWTMALRARGARVGRGFRVAGPLRILCRDGAGCRNIDIGDNVAFTGTTYLRLRRDGRIEIGDGVSLGTEVWLVTANDAVLRLGRGVRIGGYCILNGGHGIDVGTGTWFAGFVYVNSSDHEIAKGQPIQEQGYVGAPILIGPDNWLGGQVFVGKGVTTGAGAVIGAGAVVVKEVPSDAVVAGNPAKLLKYRE